jgi:hypothetical protein
VLGCPHGRNPGGLTVGTMAGWVNSRVVKGPAAQGSGWACGNIDSVEGFGVTLMVVPSQILRVVLRTPHLQGHVESALDVGGLWTLLAHPHHRFGVRDRFEIRLTTGISEEVGGQPPRRK